MNFDIKAFFMPMFLFHNGKTNYSNIRKLLKLVSKNVAHLAFVNNLKCKMLNKLSQSFLEYVSVEWI